MKFLLVVALLIFTGSCSVSSHQYYVSDNCSSVNYTPCQPLSAYAYTRYYRYYYFNGSDDSIYYFIGTSYTNDYFHLSSVRNVTLLGLSHSPSIDCGGGSFSIWSSSNISIGNISFNNCSVDVSYSNHVMIADSTHHSPSIDCGGGTFNIRYSSTISIGNISFNNCSVDVYDSNHVMMTDSTHHSPSIDCGGGSFSIWSSSNISIGNISFNNCSVDVSYSNHVMIADSTHHSPSIDCGGGTFNIRYSSNISIGNISFNNCSVDVYDSNHVMIADLTHHSPSIDCGGGSFIIRRSSNISIGNISLNNCSVDVYDSNHVMIADSTHHSPSIDCGGGSFIIQRSSNISIGNISFNNCSVDVYDSNHVMMTDSTHHSPSIDCGGGSFSIWSSSNISIGNISFNNCSVDVSYSNYVMIADSTHHSPRIDCGGGSFIIRRSSNISIGNISFNNCSVDVNDSNHVMIADSTHHSPRIDCGGGSFSIWSSSNISIGNISFNNCSVDVYDSNHVMMTDSTHHPPSIDCGGGSFNIRDSSNISIGNISFNNCSVVVYGSNHVMIADLTHHSPSIDCGGGSFIIRRSSNFSIGNISFNNCSVGVYDSVSLSIVDTVIMGNGKNSISNSRNAFISNVTITDSLSTGLTVINSNITINNTLILRNNTGTNGGGISISQNSFLLLLPQALLEFISNHASHLGGGMYYETTCPLYYANNSFQPVDDKYTPSVTFWNNTAKISGADVYDDLPLSIETCPQAVSILSSSFQPCFCSSDNTNSTIDNCTKKIPEQLIFPGQNIAFHVLMYSYDVNEGTYSPTDGKLDVVTNNVTQRESFRGKCSLIEIKPAVSSFTKFKAQLFFHIGLDINTITYFYETYEINITVNDHCPIGFSRNSSLTNECSCSQSIAGEGVACDINTLTVSHNGRLWIGTDNTSTPFASDSAFGHNETNCIIKETCLLYCSTTLVTFSMNDTDGQCKDNRGHRMCGSCRDGYSLLIGSNKCGQCNNKYMYFITAGWIALFAVMGILLVVLLIALNLTVSVGTLNGLLFYANIFKLYEPVFSTQGAVPVLSQLVSWINLDIGIEACFYNGMGAYAKEWLQLAFPLYLWVIIIFIIYLCRKYGKISRLVGSNAVPVLSTLLLLSYTKLVRTIIIILHKRQITLHCTNVKPVTVWYEDPNVEYGKGKHAALLSVALFLLLFFIIPYTLFLLFHPFYEKYLSNFRAFKKTWSKFKPVIDAYSGPMKDKYRFWPGLLLVARLALLLPVIFVDSIIDSKYFLLCMLMTVLAVLFSLYACFGGFYRQWLNGVLETWFLFNLSMMSALSLNFDVDKKKAEIFYNVCIVVFTVTFISIIIYHIHLQVSGTKWYLALLKKVKQICKKEEEVEATEEETELLKTVDTQMSEIVPTSTVVSCNTRRDSVVDLFVD